MGLGNPGMLCSWGHLTSHLTSHLEPKQVKLGYPLGILPVKYPNKLYRVKVVQAWSVSGLFLPVSLQQEG